MPFSAGRRVCLGKTFAELAVKFTLPLVFYHFDLEFSEEKHKKDIPLYSFGMAGCPDIFLNKKNRREIV